MTHFARWACFTLIAVAGCSAGPNDDPEQVGTARQEFPGNDSANFKIGVQVVYIDANGASRMGTEMTTPWASQIVGSEGWSGWASNGVGNPSGIRLHLISDLTNSTGTLFHDIDFRIGIQAKDSDTDVGPVQWTPWASAISTSAPGMSPQAGLNSGHSPGFYRVGIGIRVYPTSHRRIDDFALGAVARGHDTFVGQYLTGTPVTTPWAVVGGGGWSKTAIVNGCGCTQLSTALALVTQHTDM